MQTGGHIHQQLLLATGRTYHQLVQSADCVQHQLTLGAERAYDQPQVEGRTHLHAATDGGTSLPPATMDSETYLQQPMRTVQLHHLQPLYVRPGHRGREGV